MAIDVAYFCRVYLRSLKYHALPWAIGFALLACGVNPVVSLVDVLLIAGVFAGLEF